MLELKEVVASYVRGVDILKGVSLHIEEGEIVCLIGPNGCGKSTVLRTICSMLKPVRGKVLFKGKDISGLRPDIVLGLGICHVPQGRSVFPRMTVAENLKMGGYTLKDRGKVADHMARVYDMFPILHKRKAERAGNLSGGEQHDARDGQGPHVGTTGDALG